MSAPTTLRAALIRDEGLRLMPYKDSEGLLTIGIGRCLDRIGISLAEAEYLLDNDISRSTAAVLAHIPWAHTIDEVRREAIVNLCFNVGVGGLLGFKKALAAMQAGDYERAAAEILDSKYATQVGVRAHRVATQIASGERQ